MSIHQTNLSNPKTVVRSSSEARVQLSFYVQEVSGSYPQFEEGEQVVLNSSGNAIKRTAAADIVVGTVVVPNKDNNGQQITVAMHGSTVIKGGSTGSIPVGVRVTSVGTNTSITPNRPNIAATGSGEYADGVSLTAGTLNSEMLVLLYASPVYVA